MLQVQVTEMRSKVLGFEHPDTLNSMHDLAHTYKLRGQNDDAIDMMENVVKQFTKRMGANHSETLEVIKALSDWRGLQSNLDTHSIIETAGQSGG